MEGGIKGDIINNRVTFKLFVRCVQFSDLPNLHDFILTASCYEHSVGVDGQSINRAFVGVYCTAWLEEFGPDLKLAIPADGGVEFILGRRRVANFGNPIAMVLLSRSKFKLALGVPK